MRLAVLTSHPIQYYAPLFRVLAQRLDLHVFFSTKLAADQQASGFGKAFSWDIDLLSGFDHSFLHNVSASPDVERFAGCDTPEIGSHLRSGRFDAVLSLGWHLKSLLQGILASKRAGLAVMIRGDSQLTTPRSVLKRVAKVATYPAFLRLFDAALYVGERNRDYYEHYHYPQERLFRSPHCVETHRFAVGASADARLALRSRLKIGTDTKLVLFAGKLVAFKRPLDVVEAVANLRSRGAEAEVLVAGSGMLDQPIQERARAIGVPLHMLGFQNQSAMPAVYASADVLVLPSDGQETWGLVCNEALASGTPVVVSDAVGCASDLAAQGKAARAFRLGDSAACASALADLFASPPSPHEIAALSEGFTLEAAARGVTDAVAFLQSRKKRLKSHGSMD